MKDVYIYSWHTDRFTNEIRIYGVDVYGKNVCLKVNDFYPYIYVEIPSLHYQKHHILTILNHLNQVLGNTIIQKSYHQKYKLYGSNLVKTNVKRDGESSSCNHYEKQKFIFLKLFFKNRYTLFQAVKLLHKATFNIQGIGDISLKVHEQNASSIIQLSVNYNITSCGWICIDENDDDEDIRTTNCDFEYNIQSSHIKNSNLATIPPVKVLSWDIEVNPASTLKMPTGEHPNDILFQISCVVQTITDSKIEKYLLTLGDPEELNNTTIYRFETELELLLGFTKFVNSIQPNVMIGWNIFQFDVMFMLNRAKYYKCIPSFLEQCFYKTIPSQEKNIVWTSKAYSTTDIKFIDTEGIISIDMIDVIQKGGYRLDSYSLNSVAAFLLDETKDDLDAAEIFRCYKRGMVKTTDQNLYTKDARVAMAKVGKYCVQDSALVLKIFNHQKIWLDFSEMAKICNTTITTIHTQGQQIKFYNQLYKYCFEHNIVVEYEGYEKFQLSENDRYAGAFIFPPIPGIYKNIIPLDFSSLYPSLIIAYNIDYSTFVDSDDVPDDLCHVMEWEDHINCDHDPEVIEKDCLSEEIILLKNYLKIHTIISNIESKIKTSSKAVTLEKYRNQYSDYKSSHPFLFTTQGSKKVLKTKLDGLISQKANLAKSKKQNFICERRKFRFLKEPKGVLPNIIQNLLDSRAKVKREMKDIPKEDTDSLAIKDKLQNALKISANSMYGATGVRKGRLPFLPVAMCVTYMGRINIKKTAEYLTEYGGKIVYGDTDSNYVIFEGLIRDNEESESEFRRRLWNHSIETAKKVSLNFPRPMNLEFENAIYTQFMIFAKKKYIYLKSDYNGIVSPKLFQRGVLLVRRGYAKFIKDVYSGIINLIFTSSMNKNLPQQIEDFIIDSFIRLYSNCIKVDDLICTKKVNSFGDDEFNPTLVSEDGVEKYKIGQYIVPQPTEEIYALSKEERKNYYISKLPAQIQLLLKSESRGDKKHEGFRISYVVTDIGHKAKQSETIETVDYFKLNSDICKIDFNYYAGMLIEPIEQIFDTIKINPKFRKYYSQHEGYDIKFVKRHPDLHKIFTKNSEKKSLKDLYFQPFVLKRKVIEELKSLWSPILVFPK